MQVEAGMRIFIGPVEISGIAHSLKEGFSSLGIKAYAVFSIRHKFGYVASNKQPWVVNVWQILGAGRVWAAKKNILLKAITFFLHAIFSWVVLSWALLNFDAFVFLYGETVTKTRLELILLRLLRKKIIFLYVGSDARPPYIDGPQFPASATVDFDGLALVTLKAKKKLTLQERYADVCINSPASAQLHSRPFVNWFKIGVPKALHVKKGNITRSENDEVRILHSPSHPEIKGSMEIVNAIGRLRKKGYLINFIKIEGMPNAVVMDELARCDFVVDQLYADTPMAVFATEAAHYGKPAVVAGYFSRDICRYLNENDIPPSLFVMPDQIESAIERLIVDKEFCRQLGQKAQDFACQKWAPERVAQRFIDLIEGKIPDDWWLDPQEIRYVQGCGMPERHARYLVKELIERYGTEALQLSDKPDVERAFVEFAARNLDHLQ